ncbi:sentrin-specific protease 1-like protein [Leptotrombidium deliense]|uniref:Sentrin-specific protease 1-like protein n=1 Tax=Leptotrombidium deliense TaxID=299467 RepID=A0A443SI84_9ACAR|nr:sentrin-specific protease 1-like protein [Leptotrombidium deliense]
MKGSVLSFLQCEKIEDVTAYKLSELVRNKFGERRGGKKIPRKLDIRNISIIPAPDSEESMNKTHEDLSEKNVNSTSDETEIFSSTLLETELKKRPKLKKTANRSDLQSIEYEPLLFNGTKMAQNPNDMMDIRNLPLVFTEKAFKGSDSIQRTSWLNDDAVNHILQLILQHYECSDILLIPSYYYNLAAASDWDQLIPYLIRNRAFNKEILLVVINTDAFLSGNHWMLGAINFKSREIIILDSLENCHRQLQFENLRRIAIAAGAVANVKINIDKWEFIYASDCKKQKNSYDCGVFVILNCYAIARCESLFSIPSQLARRWIQYIGSYFEHKETRHIPVRVSDKNMNNFVNMIYDAVIEASDDILINAKPCSEKLHNYVANAKEESSFCSAVGCSFADETVNMVKCCYCRKWYHDQCQRRKTNVTYYKCFYCSELEVY